VLADVLAQQQQQQQQQRGCQCGVVLSCLHHSAINHPNMH
jgi:hypothetical protein